MAQHQGRPNQELHGPGISICQVSTFEIHGGDFASPGEHQVRFIFFGFMSEVCFTTKRLKTMTLALAGRPHAKASGNKSCVATPCISS